VDTLRLFEVFQSRRTWVIPRRSERRARRAQRLFDVARALAAARVKPPALGTS
jgi:hypothetical protein